MWPGNPVGRKAEEPLPMLHGAVLLDTILFASAFTVLISLIEIPNKSNAGLQASCRTGPFFLYLAILTIGNGVAAILASIVVSLPPQLASLGSFLNAFFGVFAFEGVMSNTNITFLDKGVLTIQDWIGKARDNAIAAALVRLAKKQQLDRNRIANALMELDEGKLDAYIDNHLGTPAFAAIVAAAAKHGDNAKFYKALEFAKREQASAAIVVTELKQGKK